MNTAYRTTSKFQVATQVRCGVRTFLDFLVSQRWEHSVYRRNSRHDCPFVYFPLFSPFNIPNSYTSLATPSTSHPLPTSTLSSHAHLKFIPFSSRRLRWLGSQLSLHQLPPITSMASVAPDASIPVIFHQPGPQAELLTPPPFSRSLIPRSSLRFPFPLPAPVHTAGRVNSTGRGW